MFVPKMMNCPQVGYGLFSSSFFALNGESNLRVLILQRNGQITDALIDSPEGEPAS